jgi:hypothetical protein
MRERDSLSRLLARHGARSGEPTSAVGRHRSRNRSGSAPLFDPEAKVRLLDASLEVFAALRALAGVTEDILRERRDSLLEGGDAGRSTSEGSDPADDRHPDAPASPPTKIREQIPLTY